MRRNHDQKRLAWSDSCDSDENDEEIWQLIFAILGHTFIFNTKSEISDHENIGKDIFLVVIACMVIKIGFSIMVSLIMAFWVYNAAPQTRQQHFFYDEGGKPHQKKKSNPYMWPFSPE